MRCLSLLPAVLLLALISSTVAAAPTVLVIESYHAEYAWDRAYRRALTERLGARFELEFFEMDTKRLPVSRHPERADAAWQQYLRSEPALVILGDDNALKHLGPRFAKTTTPVVYLGINRNPRHYLPPPVPGNISGVLERPLLKRSLAFLSDIMGRPVGRVLVLFDSGTTARTLLQENFGDQTRLRVGGSRVEIRLLAREAEWQRAVQEAKGEGFELIVMGLYHTLVDEAGSHVPEQRVMAWTSANTPLPLFGFWSFAVGEGMTIGGLVLSGYDQGVAAAQMAEEILDGGAVPRLPVSPSTGSLMFSRSQLQRWQIQLPAPIAAAAEMVP